MTKTDTSKLHLDILDRGRQELLTTILPVVKEYVLGGGTALALLIAHRKSFDFDFFSQSPLPAGLAEKLSTKIRIETISVDSADELTLISDDGIKLTFLYYPFRYAFPLEEFANSLTLFSVSDIAVKKAYAVGRRGEYRDYFDLYAILKGGHISLFNLIRTSKIIYGSLFEEKLFLSQLAYFDDLRHFNIIPVAGETVATPTAVEDFLEGQVKEYFSQAADSPRAA